MLAFNVADLPELPRGKGNKIFGISPKKAAAGEESLIAIAAIAPGQTLRLRVGERQMTLGFKALADYRGQRGQRGAVLPRGWRKVEALEVTD
jgi:topoisomerase-4 subunit A